MGALWELPGSSLGVLWELVAVAGINTHITPTPTLTTYSNTNFHTTTYTNTNFHTTTHSNTLILPHPHYLTLTLKHAKKDSSISKNHELSIYQI
jgi:hypothetical protein